MSKLFTVFGATGQQGGALIRYILRHPRFSKIYKVRGVTRDVDKPSARALGELGVEMVKADMKDPASLKEATQGSHTIFAMTNYWDSANRDVETAQGKAIADAAVTAGAELLIWSSLPRIGLPNFESKADVEDYIRTLPIKSVFFMPGWFMQNQLSFTKPQKRGDGKFVLGTLAPGIKSDTLVPLIDIEDTGKFLQPFLDQPNKYQHLSFTACTAFYTPAEMCKIWSRVTGFEVLPEEESNSEEGEEKAQGGSGTKDSPYYGVGSHEALGWTLAQMEEKPGGWESFVERHQPWFE